MLNHVGIIHFLHQEGFSPADAETLAIHLNIPKPILWNAKKDNHDVMGLFLDIIGAWLDLVEPTEELLADALNKSCYRKIANKLRGK